MKILMSSATVSARVIRVAGVAALVALLSACQAVPQHQASASGSAASTAPAALASGLNASTTRKIGPVQTLAPNSQATDVRVFLADTHAHPGWTPVPLKPSGLLYVRTDAIVDRSDLMGVQSAADQAGGGVLVLILSNDGLQKLNAQTRAHPGLHLALVVGQVMLAAPQYTSPITQQQVAFGVGSVHNAELAARSIAGLQQP
jgi:hypothetical protein